MKFDVCTEVALGRLKVEQSGKVKTVTSNMIMIGMETSGGNLRTCPRMFP